MRVLRARLMARSYFVEWLYRYRQCIVDSSVLLVFAYCCEGLAVPKTAKVEANLILVHSKEFRVACVFAAGRGCGGELQRKQVCTY